MRLSMPSKTRSFKEMPMNNRMSKTDMASIVGGTDHTLTEILAIFNNTSGYMAGVGNLTALTSTQLSYFQDTIADINDTVTGHAMLNALVDTGKTIYLNFDSSAGADAYIGNDSDTIRVLTLAFLFSPGNTLNVNDYNEAKDFFYIAHELFHAFVDLSIFSLSVDPTKSQYNAYYATVRNEADADFFAGIVVDESDQMQPGYLWPGQYRLDLEAVKCYPTYDFGLSTDNQYYPYVNGYFADWMTLIDSGDMSLVAYNSMLSNFTHGSNYGANPNNDVDFGNYVNGKTDIQLTGFDDILYFFAGTHYLFDPDPFGAFQAPGGHGSGIYYGGGFNDPYNDPLWFDLYLNYLYDNGTLNPYNNSGQYININGNSYPVYPGSWVSNSSPNSGGWEFMGGSWNYNNYY